MDLDNIYKELKDKGFTDKQIEDKKLLYECLQTNSLTAIGIDQGYANAGHAIVSYDIFTEELNIKNSGTIKTSSKKDMNKRFVEIYNDINVILNNNNNENINLMGCERLFFNKPMSGGKDSGDGVKKNPFRNKSASIMQSNMVTGVLYLISGQYDIPIKEFAPTSVKKQMTGSGKATKVELETALAEIIEKQNIKVKTDHESDAIGIAITRIKDYCEKKLIEYKKLLKESKEPNLSDEVKTKVKTKTKAKSEPKIKKEPKVKKETKPKIK